jgi:hypothetical protein
MEILKLKSAIELKILLENFSIRFEQEEKLISELEDTLFEMNKFEELKRE